MRITNNMVTRNYTKGLHTNLSRLSTYNQQIISGRRFNVMSEDTASGVRAMQTRRSLARIESYRNNAKDTNITFAAAETTMLNISNINHTVTSKYVNGITGTMGAEEREIIANELDKLRDEMVSCANGQFADRYLFGGTNVNSAPFALDKTTGMLTYNGVDVMSITKTHELFQDASYVDIGLGLNFKDTGNPQQVNPNSAFKNSFVGLDFLGTGSDNLILKLGEMIDELKSPGFDVNKAGKLLDEYKASSNNMGVALTKLGADTAFLEFTVDRLDSEELNLKTRQEIIEARSPEEAIMDFKMQEYVYNAALQMGQRLLQPTLFSFIN